MSANIQTNLLLKVSADIAGAKNGLGTLNNQISSLGSTVAKVAGLIGSAFALRDVITTTQQWGQQLDVLHDTLGLSGDAAARFNYQARVVGTTAEDVATAFGQLTNKIGNSLPAIKAGTDDFSKWGIKVFDANNTLLDTQSIVDQVREKVNALGPGLAARQLEMDLFGRSGGRLHDFLALSNDEIERMNVDLKALGLPTNVEELEAMNREGNRLGFVFDSIKVKLGSALLPVLLATGRGLAQLAGYAKVLGEALRSPLSIVKEVVERLGKFIGDIKALGFSGAIQRLIDDFLAKAREALPKIGEELDKLGPLGWAIKAAITAVVLNKIGAGMLLGALFSAAPAIGTTTLTATTIAGAVAKLGITAAIGMTATAFLFETGNAQMARMLEAGLAIYLAMQGTGWALKAATAGGAAAVAAPFILSVTAGLALGLVLDSIIPDEAKAKFYETLTRGDFWLDLLGIAAIAAATVAFGPAGLVVGIPALMILKWTTRDEGKPGGVPIPDVNAPNVAIGGNAQTGFQFGRSATPDMGLQLIGRSEDGTMGIYFNPRTGGREFRPLVGGGTGPGGSEGPELTANSVGGRVAAALSPSSFFDRWERLAVGGIVTRATPAIVGEAGPEAVIPLDRAGSMGTTIIVNVSGNITRSEKDLADMVSREIMRSLGNRRAVAF